MLKLAKNTKVVFIDEDSNQRFVYCGWNNVWSLMHVLWVRYGRDAKAALRMKASIKKLAECGYLTPDECLDDNGIGNRWYWVVEKAIPKKHREDVWANKMSIEEILKVLKV